MTFGISNSVKSQQVQICTPEMLREAMDSPLVAQVCAEIKDAWEQVKRGEITPEEFEEKKGRLKKQLPILTPHATFKNGRRLNADAVPSGLSMYDLDHIPDPEGRWREIEPRKDELGIVMAHITPSTEGLRLLFVIPDGKTLADAQRWMADQLGDQKYDECVKDYARCSFVVPREYVLFLSNSLFEERESAQTEIGNRKTENYLSTPSASLVPSVSGGQSETTDLCPQQQPIKTDMQITVQPKGELEYPELVSVLEDQLGGIPTHGSRNNFIFTMACHLRYVCNDDPEWIAQVLPTYGENREKWMATIRSACNRNQTPRMSRLMQRVLEICRERHGELEKQDEDPDLPPQMPRILPPLIRLLVSKTPDIYKPAVAHAVFPALATHLWQTRFRYIDNVEHEATLMNVLMAGTGAGKNCISEPINRIIAVR